MADVPGFTEEQWIFLAALKALAHPVTAEVAGLLTPLTPGPLLDLIDRAGQNHILEMDAGNILSLNDDLPEKVGNHLESVLTPELVSSWVEKIEKSRPEIKLESLTMIRLLERCGRVGEASALEIEFSSEALEAGQSEKALHHLTRALKRMEGALDDQELKVLFVSSALKHSNLCFSIWQRLNEISGFLEKAQELAVELGDRRSHALINLHLGRLFFFTDRRSDALITLAAGFQEVEELGDDDILNQSAFFFGLFYMSQGLHREAASHLEKAEQHFLAGGPKGRVNPNALVFLAYSLSYIGQFHRAIGSLESNMRLATEGGDRTLASTLQAVLGSLLVLLGKKQDGLFHLQQAEKESLRINNAFGRYLALGAICYQYLQDGRADKAYEMIKKNLLAAQSAGIIRQFNSPWVLELAHEFQRLGFEAFPVFDYTEIFSRVLDGPNVHLEGVVRRLLARDMMARGEDKALIREYLSRSEEALTKAGDPVQLAKTVLELARLELVAGDRSRASALARRAWRELGQYQDRFFPDEFRDLISIEDTESSRENVREETFKQYLQMLDAILPEDEEMDVLVRVVRATNRFFGAERGGIFWTDDEAKKSTPWLRAACNLTRTEVESPVFRPNMSLVLSCLNGNRPIVIRANEESSEVSNKFQAVLCIPIQSGDRVQGVLYHDNYHLSDAFDSLDLDMMMEMTHHMNLYLKRVLAHLRLREKAFILDSAQSLRLDDTVREQIVAESPGMLALLKKSDQVAASNSSILILGETGTGKELLAARIHHNSSRAQQPFIVIDAAAIPPNLVESELFGHEKGAFTGAEKRRIGRVEMANGGTLFLDEISELPLDIQVKLLRVLQEKTFYRVGGARTIHSDFRLIAATNRDLAQEVAGGNFRQDLYYRLNVVPLELPTLRHRGEDIVLLAKHYLLHFAKKHRKPFRDLTVAQKNELLKYNWPGNIRELKNIIERSVILSSEVGLELSLPPDSFTKTGHPFYDHPTLDELQRRYITYVLELTGGKIGGPNGAAEILGIKRTGLYARMKKLGMRD